MLTGYGYVMCIFILRCIVCLLISAWALRCLFYIRWAMRRPLKCGTTTVESTFFLCEFVRIIQITYLTLKYKYYGKSSKKAINGRM